VNENVIEFNMPLLQFLVAATIFTTPSSLHKNCNNLHYTNNKRIVSMFQNPKAQETAIRSGIRWQQITQLTRFHSSKTSH